MTVVVERALVEKRYNPDQLRDEDGQWATTGGVGKLLKSLTRLRAGGGINPHDEPDHGMDFSIVHKDGSVTFEVVGDQDDIQFKMPPGDFAKLHETLTDSLHVGDNDGTFEVDADNEDRNPAVMIEWRKTRKFMGQQQYDVTFTHVTPETSEDVEVDGEIQTATEDEEELNTTLAMSERDMRDWQIAMTISLLTKPNLSGHDVGKSLTADLTKDYDPTEVRDDHGRWSKIGAAIDAVSDAVGAAVRAHATFGGPHDASDTHGLVGLHDTPYARVFTLNLHDKDVGTSHVATLAAEDSEELSEGLYEASSRGRAGESGSISNYVDPDTVMGDREDEGRWWRIDYTPEGQTLHVSEDPDVSFDDDNNRQEVLLSHDDADSLGDALDEMRQHDPDNRLSTSPLPNGQTLTGRKSVRAEDRDLVLGVVTGGPDGDRLRLGLAGGEDAPVKRWTGGRGQMVADLGPAEAADLAAYLSSVADEMETYEEDLRRFDDLYDDWSESASGQRMTELTDQGWRLVQQGDGSGGVEQVVERLKPDAKWPHGREDYEPAPPGVDAEFRALLAETDKMYADLYLVDEGDTVSTSELATPWGTVVTEMIGNLSEYQNPTELRVTVRPNGVPDADFEPDEDRAILSLAGVRKLHKLVRNALADDGSSLSKAAKPGQHGSSWEHQWKHGKLAKKWIGHPHPWTALYHHLRKHMPDEMAKRTAAQWHHDVFGYWPGSTKGKNPVGPG